MYSDRELNRLAAYRASLRRRIACRRTECAVLAGRLTRPVAWLDRALAFWRRLSPFTQFAAVPLGLLVSRAVLPRRGLLGSLARWAPLALGAARVLGPVFAARSATRADSKLRSRGEDPSVVAKAMADRPDRFFQRD